MGKIIRRVWERQALALYKRETPEMERKIAAAYKKMDDELAWIQEMGRQLQPPPDAKPGQIVMVQPPPRPWWRFW